MFIIRSKIILYFIHIGRSAEVILVCVCVCVCVCVKLYEVAVCACHRECTRVRLRMILKVF